jgi:hypothetical protein
MNAIARHFAIVCLASMSMAFSLAQAEEVQRVVISAPKASATVQVHAFERMSFYTEEGRRIQVDAWGSAMRVRFNGHRALVRPQADGGYRSDDGLVSLQLQADAGGDATTARLAIPATWL